MAVDESTREFEIFEWIVAQGDGSAHRLIFVDANGRYAVPVEIVVDGTHRGIAIVAVTPVPVAADDCLSAEFFAAHAGLLGGPHVEFDAETRVLTTYNFVLTKDIASFDAFWNAIWDVTDRLRAVVYRIDLVNQGLEVQTAARIHEKELSRWNPELQTYRPFEASTSITGEVEENPATRNPGVSTDELRALGVLEHKGFYFHEDRGDYVTYSWTGIDDRWETVIIGNTEAEARQTIDKTNGCLGGGLEACDDPTVVAGFARRCQSKERDR